MIFRQLFDSESSTYTYILADEDTREAVLIDPVLEQVDRDLTLIRELNLRLLYVLDTHVHADHVTGAGAVRERTGASTVLSEKAGVGCANVYARGGTKVRFGKHELEIRETPGHTNGCVTYVLNDQSMAFTGDTLLIRGCGRTDFQQGNSKTLYHSIHEQIFVLPDNCLLYPGHDYKGRTVTTVGEEKQHNPRVGGGRSESEFVEIMSKLELAYPKKIDMALPANLACGAPTAASVDATPPRDGDWAPVEITTAGIPEIAPEWVAVHGREARMVDVREPDELISELGHIQGVELVPLGKLENTVQKWKRDEPLVLICRSAGRSGRAAVQLRSMGFEHVASMRGGMIAWNELRFPILKTPVEPTAG